MTAKALDPIKAKTRLGNALRQYKQTITKCKNKLLLYCWHSLRRLGDAWLPLQKGPPTLRVEFAPNLASADYIWHLYSIFDHFVCTPPRNLRGVAKRSNLCSGLSIYVVSLFAPPHSRPDPLSSGLPYFKDDLLYNVDEHI